MHPPMAVADTERNFRMAQLARRQRDCPVLPVSVYFFGTECGRFISKKLTEMTQTASDDIPADAIPIIDKTDRFIPGFLSTFIATWLSNATDDSIDFHARNSHWSLREVAKICVGGALYTAAELATLAYFGVILPSTVTSVACGFAFYAAKRAIRPIN